MPSTTDPVTDHPDARALAERARQLHEAVVPGFDHAMWGSLVGECGTCGIIRAALSSAEARAQEARRRERELFEELRFWYVMLKGAEQHRPTDTYVIAARQWREVVARIERIMSPLRARALPVEPDTQEGKPEKKANLSPEGPPPTT